MNSTTCNCRPHSRCRSPAYRTPRLSVLPSPDYSALGSTRLPRSPLCGHSHDSFRGRHYNQNNSFDCQIKLKKSPPKTGCAIILYTPHTPATVHGARSRPLQLPAVTYTYTLPDAACARCAPTRSARGGSDVGVMHALCCAVLTPGCGHPAAQTLCHRIRQQVPRTARRRPQLCCCSHFPSTLSWSGT